MNLPTDPPPVADATASLTDSAPLITAQQREDDFNRTFAWHGREVALTLASELYYRELRAHMHAPALGSYATLGDFAAEAPRVLYCAHQTRETLRVLRLLPPQQQIEVYDTWVEANIAVQELDAAAQLAEDINAAIARARTQPVEDSDLDGPGN